MKLRHKKHHRNVVSGSFNIASMDEIIVYFEDGSADSDSIHNYDVLLRDKSWKDLAHAFRDHDVVPDNTNTTFYFPINDNCKKRGYNP